MLSNQPWELINLELSYLSLADRIGFASLADEALVKEGPAKLTPQDASKFRRAILLQLEKDYQKLIQKNVRIMRLTGDNVMNLICTIFEQQREIAELLNNDEVSDLRRVEISDLDPEESIENIIKLDTLLDTINMELAVPNLPVGENHIVDINLSGLGLTRFPEALVARLQKYVAIEDITAH